MTSSESEVLAKRHSQRAILLFEHRSFGEAATEMLRAVALTPANPVGLAVLSLYRAENGNYEDALSTGRAAVSAGPNSFITHAYLG